MSVQLQRKKGERCTACGGKAILNGLCFYCVSRSKKSNKVEKLLPKKAQCRPRCEYKGCRTAAMTTKKLCRTHQDLSDRGRDPKHMFGRDTRQLVDKFYAPIARTVAECYEPIYREDLGDSKRARLGAWKARRASGLIP